MSTLWTRSWRRGVVRLLLVVTFIVGFGGHGAGTTEAQETAVRVVASDAETGELSVLDPAIGDVIGRFGTPVGGFSAVYPSSTGRYVLTNHYAGDQVTIVDAGLALEEHGDHVDLLTTAPFVRATLTTGPAPAHYWAHDGVIAIANDGDGTVTIIDEGDLPEAIAAATFAVAQPDHSSLVVWDDIVYVGYYDLGRVDAYSLGGELIAANIGPCPAAHGEAVLGDAVIFACERDLLRITRDGDEFAAVSIPYPGQEAAVAIGTPATATPTATVARIGSFATNHEAEILAGGLGEDLALVSAEGDDLAFTLVPMPATPLAFAYDPAGDTVVVLTTDGTVLAIDPAAAEIVWTAAAVATPYTEIELGDGFDFYPTIAATDRAVYIADPATGEVVELAIGNGAETNRFAVGGQPARVAVVEASGIQH